MGYISPAEALRKELDRMVNAQFETPSFSAFGRTSQLEALRLRGFDIKRFPRWPAKPLTEEARGTIRTALERLGVPLGKAR